MKGPGEKDFEKMGIPNPMQPDSSSRSADSVLVRSNGGDGGGGTARKTLENREQSNQPPEPPPETYEFPTEEATSPADTVKADTAVLSDAKWTQPDTLFHQEAEISVHVTLPDAKKEITRIRVELFAKTPTGPELISKGEGHAQADGTAVMSVPVYKPKGYVDGPVEYFFQIVHSLAKMLSGEKQSRQVSEMALKSMDHVLVPGIAFDRESSFIPPKGAQSLKPVEAKFNEWDKKYPKKSQIAVFGHSDKDEKDAKGLSERRAQSAFAFITNDAATWDKLYSVERWGLKALQSILKDLGHYHGATDGEDGPKTQDAFKAFRNSTGVSESEKEGATTRKALFAEYMKGKHDIKIDASRFCKVAENPWMGCAANNKAKESKEAAPENCRVAFILIVPNKNFPMHFPCQDGSDAACQAQCKKAGKRSSEGIKCFFYDELVREGFQNPVPESPKAEKNPEGFDRISFDGYEGKGYVIKDFKKHQGSAIQLNPEKVSPSGADLPDGFNNQCVSFVRYFGLPQTISWKKGPRVCDFKPGELSEGTVVATLRDGLYHSDNSGRSHVGIYLVHDDYNEYSKNASVTAGVKMMDQWKGASIDSRLKKYGVDAENETNKKTNWTDIDGGNHENRANWINDGEEYYVVLTQ
ncbi:MAG: BPSL0067 family protein [Fibrobacteria bacterium]